MRLFSRNHGLRLEHTDPGFASVPIHENCKKCATHLLRMETLLKNYYFKKVKEGNTIPISCAMGCGRVVGSINREEGDDFGEFYHCATCLDDRVDGICDECEKVKLVRKFTDGDPDALYNTTVDYYLCETCEEERDE